MPGLTVITQATVEYHGHLTEPGHRRACDLAGQPPCGREDKPRYIQVGGLTAARVGALTEYARQLAVACTTITRWSP
jgi:hypothetical protein